LVVAILIQGYHAAPRGSEPRPISL